MKIKVCGMKHPDNIAAAASLTIDYIGLIFYDKSPRHAEGLPVEALELVPQNIKRVAVFVNETVEKIAEKIAEYQPRCVQLHGDESPEFCLLLKSRFPQIEIIKAFGLSTSADILKTEKYKAACNYFLFDTRTTPLYGGSGMKFDWNILHTYTGDTPFFLSGGISEEDVEAINRIEHPQLHALDLNSKFELTPGLKDIKRVERFIKQLHIND